MLRDLEEKGMLPAVVCNLSNETCVGLALALANELKAADEENKKTHSSDLAEKIKQAGTEVAGLMKLLQNYKSSDAKTELEQQVQKAKEYRNMEEIRRFIAAFRNGLWSLK
jgi:hypothetical protein